MEGMEWVKRQKSKTTPRFVRLRNNCLLMTQDLFPQKSRGREPCAVRCQWGWGDSLCAQQDRDPGRPCLQWRGSFSLPWNTPGNLQAPTSSAGAARKPRKLWCQKDLPSLSPLSTHCIYPPTVCMGPSGPISNALYLCHVSYHEKLILLGHLSCPESPWRPVYGTVVPSHTPAQILIDTL